MVCGGMIFIKKFQILEKEIFILFYFVYFFKCYYCSINQKRQSEHSGFRPDTSSLVRIHFSKVTDVNKYKLILEVLRVSINLSSVFILMAK